MSMFSADFSDVILVQYNNANKLKTIISNKQNYYNENIDDFLVDWYKNIFNLETANYFGLIVWALIFGCTEYINIKSKIGQKAFGFGEYHKNFFESNFALSNYIQTLDTEHLRTVLKAQMYNFNSNGSLYDLNRIITMLYPNNHGYATIDHENYIITIHFPIALDEYDLNVVLFSNALPVPVGFKRQIENGITEE